MKRALSALALSLVVFASADVRADAVEDAAKARYAEGTKLYNKKKYEEARAAFMQAIALKKRPAAVMMLAESALKSGRWLEAVKNFDEFVAMQNGAELQPKLKDLVENGRKEARAHIGRFTFDVPDGAEVTVDGEKLPDLKPLDVAVGTHEVTVTHRQETKTLQVPAEAGKITDVHPSFVPKAIIPTDTRTRPTPLAPKPATPTSPAADEGPSFLSPPATKWPLYTLGAVGIGGLATAAVFGGLAANARHGVEVMQQTIARNAKPGATCSDADSFKDAAKGQSITDFQATCDSLTRQQHFADIHQGVFQTSLIVGLAGFAGAVAYFFVAPKEGAVSDAPKENKESTLVIPWAGLGGGGVNIEGRF